jgi:hypothetical protein
VHWLPVISASGVAGLTETLANSPFNGSAELLSLAISLRLNVAELFRVAVEATSAINGIGLVKLIGRASGLSAVTPHWPASR